MSTDNDQGNATRGSLRLAPSCAELEELKAKLDAGEDLVIHYAADGQPWLWEIEHASQHPEHIAAALDEVRRRSAMAAE